MARVLGGDQIDFFENPQRTQSNIFEVADRRGDDIENSSHDQNPPIRIEESEMEDCAIFDPPSSILDSPHFPQSRE